jgi:hypothetical protein
VKPRDALDAREVPARGAVFGFDLPVGIEERTPEAPSQHLTDGRLSRPHRPDENEMAAVVEHVSEARATNDCTFGKPTNG